MLEGVASRNNECSFILYQTLKSGLDLSKSETSADHVINRVQIMTVNRLSALYQTTQFAVDQIDSICRRHIKSSLNHVFFF